MLKNSSASNIPLTARRGSDLDLRNMKKAPLGQHSDLSVEEKKVWHLNGRETLMSEFAEFLVLGMMGDACTVMVSYMD